MATAIAFGVSATAFGAVNADQTSQVNSAFAPNAVSADTPTKGALFTEVTTLDTDNSPVVPAEGAENVTIKYDDSIAFDANSKLAKCAPAGGDPTVGTFAATTTQGAVDACGAGTVVGSGLARARFAGFPFTDNEADFTVTAFNGPTSIAGQQTGPQSVGGFVGGNPTIILHARSHSLGATSVAWGEIKDTADVSSDYGSELFVPNAPDVAGDAGAITLFNAVVQKSFTNGKTGNKKKKFNYVSATCDDVNKIWSFKADWIYDDGSTDSDVFEADCATN
jgi:hypothetical protein